MALKTVVRKLYERSTGTQTFARLTRQPRGVDLNLDLKKHLPSFIPDVVFDVGAHVGQSTEKFLRWFPHAEIFCFEPVTYSFANLQKNVRKFENVHCFNMAVGDKRGQVKMQVRGISSMNAVWDQEHSPAIPDGAELQTVEITSLSEFCSQNGIHRVNFLKIDTEGHDFTVLKGAEQMLNEKRIDLIQAEVSMSPTNRDHVPFEEVKSFLESKDYLLFGIYEQVGEWKQNKPNLRRTNPVFLTKNLMDLHHH